MLSTLIFAFAAAVGFVLYRTLAPSPTARSRLSSYYTCLIRICSRIQPSAALTAVPRRAAVGFLLFILLGVTAFTFGSLQSTNTVTLPIEVIGPDGTTRSVTVYASDVSDVDHLYIRAHSIGYPDHIIETRGYKIDKASIRINGGSWVDVSNDIVTCEEPEESIGCVTGPYHTIRFKIPISEFGSLQSGSNTVDFRFNYAAPDVSTGYRILDLQLQRGNGSDAIDGTEFVWDNPAEWRPPAGYDNQSAIDAGKKLWHQRNRLADDWNGNGQLVASCGDCHADNGRDLQYFAYTNESIIKRSEFHGLSEKEGKQIAAYIRSIELRTKDGSTYDPPGRPWEPPYQPGPTAFATRSEDDPRTAGQPFEEIDQQYWAAGAGLDWVFDDDAETYPYLFPGGPSQDDIDPAQRKLNMRTLPLALQMPDWNEWLPVHHPLDAFDDFENPNGTSGGRCQPGRQDAWSYYQNEVKNISGSTRPREVESKLNTFFKKVDDYRACNNPISEVNAGIANISVMQWGAVKMWEILHTHSLEDLGPELYPDGEPLSWPGKARVLFNIAPHIVKHPDGGLEAPKGDREKVTDVYYDTAWYQHQLTLNAGHNYYTGLKPVDWKYHFQHVRWYDGVSSHNQSVRYTASYMKMLQAADLAPDDARSDEPEGWYLRHLTPAWLLDKSKSDISRHHLASLDKVTTNGRCHVTEELLRFFVRGMTEEPMSEWTREEGRLGLEPESFVPSAYPDPLIFDNETYANHFYRMLPIFGEVGVSSDVLYDLADWADKAWPKADPSFRDRVVPNTSCGPADEPAASFEATLTAPSDGKVLTASASLTLTAEVSVPPERSVSKVTFQVDDEAIGEDTDAPYTFDWQDASPGTYELTVEATDNHGETTVSPPVTIEILPAHAGVAWYEYYEGSWSELPNFDELSPASSGVATDFDLDVRERDDEFAIRFTSTLTVPESGEYTFYTNSDDGSMLWIGDSLVVDNGGTHALQERQGKIELSEGKHRLTVGYLEAFGQQELEVSWAGPGFAKESISAEQLSPGRAQTIRLSQGWNLVSSHITPFSTALDTLFADAADDIVLVKDEEGNTFVPEYDVNTIGSWEPHKAYMIYAETDRDIVFEGLPVTTAETALDLDTGWNFVSYLPTASMPVEAAFASLDNALVMVKNYAGDVYIPGYDINTIGDAEPGQGYKVYVDERATLTYPSENEALSASTEADKSSSGVPSSAVLVLEASALGEGTSVSAWSSDRMLSQATVQEGKAVLSIPGDAEDTDVQEGARADEQLTLKHESDGQTKEIPVTAVEDAFTGQPVDGPIRYRSESFLLASIDATPAFPLELGQNYPNPFSTSATVEYTIPSRQSVRIEIYDALGRRVQTLVDEIKEAGTHEVKIDARSLSSGTYFYQLEVDGETKTQQMVVVR